MKSKEEIYNLLVSTVGIMILGLAINLLSWQFRLVSGGLPGYALIANYVTGISVGTFLLIANSLILVTSLVVTDRSAGLRGVYGYVFLSLFIDFSRKSLGLEQFELSSMLLKIISLTVQGIIAPVGIALVMAHDYSFGSYSSMMPIVNRFMKVSPPIFFFALDLLLTTTTLVFFGAEKAMLLLINAGVFFVSFHYALKFFKANRANMRKLFF